MTIRNRELSQFGSFIYIDNNTKDIGITTEATPYVGIGTTNATSKFHVVGETKLEGDVNVSGVSTFSSDLDINASIDISSNLNVSGLSTFASDVDINASTNIQDDLIVGGNFDVTGVSTFASNLDINASVDISDNLNVTGLSTFTSNVDINASTNIQDDLIVGGNFNVTGVSTFASNLDINASIDVDGFTELDATNISETLNVVGVSTFASDLDINASVDVSNDLNVSGVSTFASNVDINSSVDISDNLNVIGLSTFASDLDINASVDISNNLGVSGVSTFQNNVYLLDNDILHIGGTVGSVGDLQIKSDGATSYIEERTDALRIYSDDLYLQDYSTAKVYLRAQASGSVELYYNNYKKFETTDDGITVFGTTESQQLVVSGLSTFSSDLDINASVDILDNLSVSGITTLASSGGITTTGGDLYVGGDLYISDDVIFDELNARNADFSENLNVSGIGTIATLNTTNGTITTLNTTNGTIDYLSGTNVSYSGIGTIETLNATNGDIDYLSGTNVSYIGIGTIETLDVTTGTIDYLSNINLNTSGIATLGITTINELYVSGVSTFGDVYVGSAVTISAINGTVGATTFYGNFVGSLYGALDGNAGTATSLETAKDFSITGDFVTASTISFDATDNVALAATITPNSIGLGTYTSGDYVKSVSGTANEIVIIGGTGESSTPIIGLSSNLVLPGNLLVNGITTFVGITSFSNQLNFENVSAGIVTANEFYLGGSLLVDTALEIWTPITGDDIYRRVGNVGIGTSTSLYKLSVNGQIESQAEQGTAPFVVRSTTNVPNLNADTVDGRHAPSGDIVGTTDLQTLTNKSINLANNTLTGTISQFNTALSDDNFATLNNAVTLTNKTLTSPSIGIITNTGGTSQTIPTGIGALVSTSSVGVITTGMIAAVAVSNSQLINSTISGVSLGGNLFNHSPGSYLTGNAYNGSSAETWGVNATSSNTADTIVARDSSGHFSASDITAQNVTVSAGGTFFGDGSGLTDITANVAVKVSAADTSTAGPFYLTFVDSNNTPAEYETLFTDGGITYDALNVRLGIGSAVPTSTLSVEGDINVSGVVTALAFYGDGSNLENIVSGVGLRTEGSVIGYGITFLDFRGAEVTSDNVTGIGTIDIKPTQIIKDTFVVSGIQTSFNLSNTYVPGYVDVYFNGVKLNLTDYTEVDSDTIDLAPPAVDGDIVEIVNYKVVSNLTSFTTTYATTAGIATYATSSGIAIYATSSGIATYADYATSSGIATYATNAGIATYADYATSSGIATYATNAGIATYSSTAGIATALLGGNAGVNTTTTSTNLYVYGNAASNIVGLGTTDANTTLDFSQGNNFSLILTNSIVLSNPTGVTTGQSGIIMISQDGIGSRTCGFGSHWDFPNSTPPTLSTGANSLDVITYFVRSSTSIVTNSLIGIGTL